MCTRLPSVHAASPPKPALRSAGRVRRWQSVASARHVLRTTFMLRAQEGCRLVARPRAVRHACLEQASCSVPAAPVRLFALCSSGFKCASPAALTSLRGACAIRPVRRVVSSSDASSHSRSTPPGSASATPLFWHLVSGSQLNAWPNPSVKASPNGMPPGPGRRYAVHFRQPGPGVMPSAPPYLELQGLLRLSSKTWP